MKLLDITNIAVVTIRDAFLEDEEYVIANLSSSLGYDVKVLRSLIISDETSDNVTTRIKRALNGVGGASLELYVYGLIQQEPVTAGRLIE